MLFIALFTKTNRTATITRDSLSIAENMQIHFSIGEDPS